MGYWGGCWCVHSIREIAVSVLCKYTPTYFFYCVSNGGGGGGGIGVGIGVYTVHVRMQ